MSQEIVIPLWIQIAVACPLLISAVFTILGALGLLRFDNFYLRMHPTAIVFTLGAWCVCIAVLIFFTATQARPALYAWLIVIMLAITIPITTVVLARAVLFRKRQEGLPAPASLSYTIVLGDMAPMPDSEQGADTQTEDL